MAEITLNVRRRDSLGTQAMRKLRRQDLIPGIFYFHGSNNIPFIVERTDLHSIWGHESGLLTIVFDGKDQKKGVIRDIQFDPVKGTPIHLDLMGIKMTEKLQINVSVQLVGTPEGVKNAGGILQQTLREIEVECLPSDIPESIEVDVSELGIGDSLDVSTITPGNFVILADSTTVVATVTAPRILAEEEEEEEAEEGEEEMEPEVLSQKPEEEE